MLCSLLNAREICLTNLREQFKNTKVKSYTYNLLITNKKYKNYLRLLVYYMEPRAPIIHFTVFKTNYHKSNIKFI